MRYKDHKLGTNAHEVLKAFCSHPGKGPLRPFGRDIHGGFEFFYHPDERCYYEKGAGTMQRLHDDYEHELLMAISEGTIELYLRRPTSGIRTDLVIQKEILHAATGMPIPLWPTKAELGAEDPFAGIESYCQQVCGSLGSAMCGSGKICGLGVNRATQMPDGYIATDAQNPSVDSEHHVPSDQLELHP